MGKICVEVCLISGRGLRRSSSFWKLQWFAVGWIDPNNKYCTRIDASGNANPVWKTKFSISVDDSNLQDIMLHVEVYSREPFFLREKLLGTATVALKEFMTKHSKISEESAMSGTEEAGSYQLRKGNSSKPQGFVDISVRILKEREEPSSFSGEGGLLLMDHSNNIAVWPEGGSGEAYFSGPAPLPSTSAHPPHSPSQNNFRYNHPVACPPNHSNLLQGGPSYSAGGNYYQPPRTPPPPPPPSNVGYIPMFLPRTENYVNMPSSGTAPGRGPGPGFGMGVGAGALAAGAIIFGDDFLSGFDFPGGSQDASLTISTDPPF